MAAPSHLFTHKVVSQKTGRADKLVLLTSAAESSTVLKTRFYLDGFFIREHNGVKKWAGYCIVGSTNYYMHAEARHSWLRERRNGQDIVVFWDAGLNTLAPAFIGLIPYKWANNIGVNTEFIASYYNHSSSLGIRYKKTSSSSWITQHFGEGLMPNTSKNTLRHLTPSFDPLDSVDLQLFNENEEGTYYSNIITLTVDDNVWSYGVLKRATACSSTGQVGVIVWIKEADQNRLNTVTESDANTGIFLYTDVTMTTKVDAGWYFGLDDQKAFQVNSNGEIRKYENCTTSLPTVTLNYEMDINGLYRFRVSLSSVYSANVTVSFRIDVGELNTPKAKYVSITVNAGSTSANEPIWRDLSDDTYHIYDATVTPAIIPLVVTPL